MFRSGPPVLVRRNISRLTYRAAPSTLQPQPPLTRARSGCAGYLGRRRGERTVPLTEIGARPFSPVFSMEHRDRLSPCLWDSHQALDSAPRPGADRRMRSQGNSTWLAPASTGWSPCQRPASTIDGHGQSIRQKFGWRGATKSPNNRASVAPASITACR